MPGHKKGNKNTRWFKSGKHGWIELPEGATLIKIGGMEMLHRQRHPAIPLDDALATGLVCAGARGQEREDTTEGAEVNSTEGLEPLGAAAPLRSQTPPDPPLAAPKDPVAHVPARIPPAPPAGHGKSSRIDGRTAIARTRPKPVPATDTRTGEIPTGQDLIDRSMRRIGAVIDNTQDPNKLAGVIKRTREQMDLDTITKRAVPIQDYTARDRLIKLAGGERYQDVMGCEPSTRFAAALRDEVSRPPSEG